MEGGQQFKRKGGGGVCEGDEAVTPPPKIRAQIRKSAGGDPDKLSITQQLLSQDAPWAHPQSNKTSLSHKANQSPLTFFFASVSLLLLLLLFHSALLPPWHPPTLLFYYDFLITGSQTTAATAASWTTTWGIKPNSLPWFPVLPLFRFATEDSGEFTEGRLLLLCVILFSPPPPLLRRGACFFNFLFGFVPIAAAASSISSSSISSSSFFPFFALLLSSDFVSECRACEGLSTPPRCAWLLFHPIVALSSHTAHAATCLPWRRPAIVGLVWVLLYLVFTNSNIKK